MYYVYFIYSTYNGGVQKAKTSEFIYLKNLSLIDTSAKSKLEIKAVFSIHDVSTHYEEFFLEIPILRG